jgi:hypothetical protein
VRFSLFILEKRYFSFCHRNKEHHFFFGTCMVERGKTDSGQIWYVKRQQGVPSPGAGSWLQDRKTRQIIVQTRPPGFASALRAVEFFP